MTRSAADLVDDVLAESHPDQPPPVPATQQKDKSALTAAPDGSVYREAARACLPRLLQRIGSAPWFEVGCRGALAGRGAAWSLYGQQSATLAVALLVEIDRDLRGDEHLFERVRASLIRWQLSLHGDGRPAQHRLRRSPLHGAILGLVSQTVMETTGFQSEMLLDDIARHIKWVTGRPQQTPWLEAATICAMADSAVLVRDLPLLKDARRRLKALLELQDVEGWFPERGGADMGRLSLTVDALARLYRQNEWEELREPLRRACEFMLHFVNPRGGFGGCYSSCGTAFLSPYGVELLAPTLAEAASLALVARRRFQRFSGGDLGCWHDDLLSVAGPRLALAASVAPPELPTSPPLPHQALGEAHFPNAGLSIHVTDAYHAVVGSKNGGTLHATWTAGGPCLDEPGVTVVFPHKIRTASRRGRSVRTRVSSGSVTSQGPLETVGDDPGRTWLPAARLFHRAESLSGRREDAPPMSEPAQAHTHGHHLRHDEYRREIHFDKDVIRIRDVVRCRLPCQAVVCQSASPADTDRFVDADAGSRAARPPIFADGGRYVEITRTYRNGVLVEQSSERNRSMSRGLQARTDLRTSR